ncbi:MAG TPA: hypothetical protein VHG28_16595 [Longimicrobiaceae bacterium]|nr:hypothetical protein [Longimicrobiaceae bacterium]
MRDPTGWGRPPVGGVLVLVFLAVLAGCASAARRYEQGVELEQQGRSVEAARRYIETLRKDPSLQDARRRLAETGARATDDLLRESAALEAGGRSGEAAEVLLRLEALRRDAAAVGVPLTEPSGYAERRRAVFDRAIEAALAAAAAPQNRGWDDALRELERAGARLDPSPEQRERLARARSGVYLSWGEAEAARGRYRAAYDVVERGLRELGRGPEAERLALFQADLLRRGTVRVAVLPLAAREELRRRLPEELLPETDDVLAERHWPGAPPFVEVTDPARVEREARREGYVRRPASVREAARLARTVGADLAVVVEMDSVRLGETQVRESRRPARTRDGVDTAYVLREGRREAWARVSLTLVDARDARVLDRATATAERSGRFRRGVFTGDWRTLNLPRDDRNLFAPDAEERVLRDLVLELAGELGDRVAREVFEAVLRQVP